jgi:GDP-4-dehydro-6-deoxy-D-mannose reductase
MNVLVIGAAGFVGKYLIDDLIDSGYHVYATKLSFENLSFPSAEVINLNIENCDDINAAFLISKPDLIFNLAALSSVSLSWKNIKKTFEINLIGSVNLLNCVKESSKKSRVVLIGSSEEYGVSANTQMPISECTSANPSNPYAISKMSQAFLGSLYANAFSMDVIMMRAFNHIGPGQPKGFAVPDFCEQIAKIEAGIVEPIISTGNLAAKRDFTDVRDITKGYIACALHGKSGQIYNIGSGHATSIEEILNELLSLSTKKIKRVLNPDMLRPIDVPLVEADITKLTQATGWKPLIPLSKSLKDTLEYWRKLN